jgi:serine/threonine protein phosphatase PrpC
VQLSSGAASVGAPNLDNYLTASADRVVWRVGDSAVHTVQPGEGHLLAVAAGEGLETGEVASFSAVRVLAKLFGPTTPRKPERVLLRYLAQAHDALFAQAHQSGQVLGTSIALLWAPQHDELAWAQVGDCRIVRLREGRVSQLSIEHTRQAYAQRHGRAAPVEPDVVTQRFIQGSAGLGDDAALHLEPGLDVGHEVMARGDRYLLCSAPVWRALDPRQLAEDLGQGTAQQAAQQIVQTAHVGVHRGCLTAAVLFAD